MKTDTPSSLNTKNRHRVRVGRSSAGLGLFASDSFKKGERIVEYTGKRLTNEQVKRVVENRYLLEINDRYTINGSSRENIARYANHACKPNAIAETVRGRAFLIAKKAIRPDEEIVWDYGKEYFNDFIKDGGCRCTTCVAKRKTAPGGAVKPV
ncbi:MAG: hypothetical protein B7X04_00825 [Parcubacteria group bacterium 21-54-25]|nr:MAG: hypothetical protein B7X04_00825 [Parcubacteria group bacterium 21-54-25]HQU07947.1 SET domain-containing protein [Candidatus Paceibacterota bacterium]